MNFEIKDNLIIIKQDSLDIYDAPVLKEKIAAAASADNRTVVLDLQNVGDMSTPAIQVLIAAKKSFEGLKILNIKESVVNNLILLNSSL